MSDVLESIAGNKMLQLKNEMAQLREAIKACNDEEKKKLLRREYMEAEMYYNILAERQKG
ncbi:MAG: hypothetical protein LUF25_06585 [Phascolarctobacterium sp.]|nr:hypothetical protein [Phascolarctobacterium sp.]